MWREDLTVEDVRQAYKQIAGWLPSSQEIKNPGFLPTPEQLDQAKKQILQNSNASLEKQIDVETQINAFKILEIAIGKQVAISAQPVTQTPVSSFSKTSRFKRALKLRFGNSKSQQELQSQHKPETETKEGLFQQVYKSLKSDSKARAVAQTKQNSGLRTIRGQDRPEIPQRPVLQTRSSQDRQTPANRQTQENKQTPNSRDRQTPTPNRQNQERQTPNSRDRQIPTSHRQNQQTPVAAALSSQHDRSASKEIKRQERAATRIEARVATRLEKNEAKIANRQERIEARETRKQERIEARAIRHQERSERRVERTARREENRATRQEDRSMRREENRAVRQQERFTRQDRNDRY